MHGRFKAYRIHQSDAGPGGRFEHLTLDDLSDGDVVVRVRWSSVNYKDSLAATGAGSILRRFPLVGGIDLAGTIESSSDRRYRGGDKVLVTGCGLGEDHDGGYAQYARVRGEWVIPLPDGLSLKQVMGIGTAGFTAALAIDRMEHNSQRSGGGPVVVTGATGGVGSFAVNMLAERGYEVVAVTGKTDAAAYLKKLGAASVLLRNEIDSGRRPLERAQWAGAIDNVGGETLAWLTRTTRPWGNIASVGLAGGHELNTTVMPFILRGVNLLGINSAATPRRLRLRIWKRISTDLKPSKLAAIASNTVAFDALPKAFEPLLAGKVIGRTVVRIA